MPRAVIPTLKTIIAIALAGSLFVEAVILPLLLADLAGEEPWVRTAVIVIAVLGIGTLQICAVCIWRLLTMVRKGSVFSDRSLRDVDVVIGSIGAASLLALALAFVLAPGGTAPGVVGLVCGAALVIAGVALLVAVMRALLIQSTSTDAEARELRAELDEVV